MAIHCPKLCAAMSISLAIGFTLACSNLTSRSNDEKANQIMRDIRTAESTFKNTKGAGRYGTLKDLVDAGLLSNSLTDGAEAGHRYEIKASGDSYEAVAVLMARDDKYQYVGWSFYLNESGVIRGRAYGKASDYRIASKDDPAVRYQSDAPPNNRLQPTAR